MGVVLGPAVPRPVHQEHADCRAARDQLSGAAIIVDVFLGPKLLDRAKIVVRAAYQRLVDDDAVYQAVEVMVPEQACRRGTTSGQEIDSPQFSEGAQGVGSIGQRPSQVEACAVERL